MLCELSGCLGVCLSCFANRIACVARKIKSSRVNSREEWTRCTVCSFCFPVHVKLYSRILLFSLPFDGAPSVAFDQSCIAVRFSWHS